jgi:hypothetical protein
VADAGVVEDPWVAGGERLDLGVGEAAVAEVVDGADVETAAVTWLMNLALRSTVCQP